MTSNIRHVATTSVVICATLCLIFVVVVRPHGSRPDSTQPPSPHKANGRGQGRGQSFDEIKRHFPKVDYDAPEPTDATERARRRQKGLHYDHGYISKKPTGNSSLQSEWDWNLPAIPVRQSSVVVIGKTLSGGAYMSPDKSGVYTEYSVKIEEVLQTDRDSLTNDRTIDVSRMGGVVRYQTGEESLFFVTGQNMPILGKRYLLFLKTIPGSDDFEIVTGYEFSPSGSVLALDNPNQFREQNGREINGFIEAVKSAVQQKRSN